MIDSITRFAMAHREIGLAAGELPAARGYPPSTMSALPQLLERAGTSDRGTITAIYTVLVDGDDMDEPVADAVRGIVDGHIVLSRTLANSGHFPQLTCSQASHDSQELSTTTQPQKSHVVDVNFSQSTHQ